MADQFRARPAALPPPLASFWAWGVPYRRILNGTVNGKKQRYVAASEAVIALEVLELRQGCACPEIASFVVDTGTDMTILPRNACPRAFRGKPLHYVDVTGLTGRSVQAPVYRVALSIPRGPHDGHRVTAISFGDLDIAVIDPASWGSSHGMLGLDALRRLLMISSTTNVYFLPPVDLVPASRGPASNPPDAGIRSADSLPPASPGGVPNEHHRT